MQKKRKFIFLIVSLLLVSLSLSFAPYAHADIHNGTRSFYGVKYDSSAQTKTFRHNEKTYNYRDIYDTGEYAVFLNMLGQYSLADKTIHQDSRRERVAETKKIDSKHTFLTILKLNSNGKDG